VKFIDDLLSCWLNYSSWRLQSPVVAGISGRAAQEKRNAKSKYNEMCITQLGRYAVFERGALNLSFQ
jgi:hypothetical protein